MNPLPCPKIEFDYFRGNAHLTVPPGLAGPPAQGPAQRPADNEAVLTGYGTTPGDALDKLLAILTIWLSETPYQVKPDFQFSIACDADSGMCGARATLTLEDQ